MEPVGMRANSSRRILGSADRLFNGRHEWATRSFCLRTRSAERLVYEERDAPTCEKSAAAMLDRPLRR